MLENTEHLRDWAGELKQVTENIKKVRMWFFTVFWEPENIIEHMNNYRSFQNKILKK